MIESKPEIYRSYALPVPAANLVGICGRAGDRQSTESSRPWRLQAQKSRNSPKPLNLKASRNLVASITLWGRPGEAHHGAARSAGGGAGPEGASQPAAHKAGDAMHWGVLVGVHGCCTESAGRSAQISLRAPE